jgi:hypothetical protein
MLDLEAGPAPDGEEVPLDRTTAQRDNNYHRHDSYRHAPRQYTKNDGQDFTQYYY